MSSELKIVFLNINSIYDKSETKTSNSDNQDNSNNDNQNKENDDNNLESPTKILDSFLSNLIKLDFEKIEEAPLKTEYDFVYQIEEGVAMTCTFYVFSDLSEEHTEALEADAYIVFCNIEKEETEEKLKNIFKYMEESCDINSQKSIIGVYQKEKLPQEFLKRILDVRDDKNKGVEEGVKFYEIFMGGDTKKNGEGKEEENKGNMNNVLEQVFFNIYQEKKKGNPIFVNRKNKNDKETDKCKACFIC